MKTSLVEIGELSKPIDTLIIKIANAAGTLYEPTRIKREALANAEAEKIRMISSLEINDLQQRAMQRFLYEETVKQQNIESIIEKSLKIIKTDAQPEKIENDWITYFFDKSKFISDNKIQELWAEILGGESNTPGTYSKRTIEQFSLLSKNDAELFINLCKFIWKFEDTVHPLILNLEDDIYKKHNISFSNLTHLQSIGLITFDTLSSFSLTGFDKNVNTSYYNNQVIFEFDKEKENELSIGYVVFTQTGKELSHISLSNEIQDFYYYILSTFEQQNVKCHKISNS